jgi:GT2 family glycosyltransferase
MDGTLRQVSPPTPTEEVLRPSPRRLVGFVERIADGAVSGWAWCPEEPDAAVQVDILIGGRFVMRLAADGFRKDLLAAGHGTGCYSFAASGLGVLLEDARELVSVRFAGGGADLSGSPRWMSAPLPLLEGPLARSVETLIAGALEAATQPEQLDAPVALAAKLLQRAASLRAALHGSGRGALDVLAESDPVTTPLAASARALRESFPPLTLPVQAGTPDVSVVIPAHGRFDLTYRCLASIAAAGAGASFEVVLVDDGSADETLLADLVFGGTVRVLRRHAAGGFLRAANAGAAAARGRHLLFLNNDTEVEPGWLDELLGTFDALPGIGIAGSKLVYPDGTLQEAGGIVGRHGEAMNWGLGLDPGDPRFCHLRDADYVSGAALMIPRALFERLGGFDEAFAPGYYEDTDLCFRVRHEAGLRVVVQPLSRVIHHEGGTAGRDTGIGPKRFQRLNHPRFFHRWKHVLETHRPLGEDLHLESERQVGRRAVFVDEIVPTPDRDAGSNAAFAHLTALQALGYAVTFIPSSHSGHAGRYTEALQRIGIACLHAPHVGSVEEGLRRLPAPPDLVYLHRGANAARYTGLVRELFPEAHLVYSVADLHFLRLAREAETTGDATRRAEAARSEAAELHAVRSADAVIVHSPVEAALLAERVPEARVHVVPWTVPLRPVETPVAARSGLAFIGGYGHRPNVDAAIHLVRDVMPMAWDAIPGLPCLLVGSDLPREVAVLGGGAVEVSGHVPDLAEVFARLRCTAAPLRYGAGIKGKVLTSLAHGVPCVMSAIAAEGISLPRRLRWLVAADSAAMAAKIVVLHRDDALVEEMSAEGLAFVRDAFGDDKVREALAAATLSPSWQKRNASEDRVGRDREE